MQGKRKEKKNILYIFNDTGFGGAGQSLLDTLTEIKDEINPIVIIRGEDKVEDRFRELGIKCYQLHFNANYVKIGSADEYKRSQDIAQSYEAAMQLVPIIEKENIQLIHINSSVSYFAALSALMIGIPYIWHIRELMEEQFGCEFLNKELMESLFKRADRLIAISDYVKEIYYNKYGLETARLYNGLNIKRFKKNIWERDRFENSFIVASMITPEKGQFDVIQATELLVSKGYKDIKVIIVGSGAANYVWALQKYIEKRKLGKNICVLPYQEDLSQLRSQASYAITSSQNEALGRVTIESMLAGNLIIGAKSGGTIEIVGENEERGFLYELHNSISLADTMEKAMKCECGRKNQMRQRAQEYAEKTFDSKSYCEELIKIYDNALVSFQYNRPDKLLCDLDKYYNGIKDNYLEKTGVSTESYKKSALAFPIAVKWLEIKQKKHSLAEYFEDKGIHNIAIYGMGPLGCRLYDELEYSSIEIRYLMDRNPKGIDNILDYKTIGEEMDDVDVIVVTVISAQDQIISEIRKHGYSNVIGLSEIIWSFNYI